MVKTADSTAKKSGFYILKDDLDNLDNPSNANSGNGNKVQTKENQPLTKGDNGVDSSQPSSKPSPIATPIYAPTPSTTPTELPKKHDLSSSGLDSQKDVPVDSSSSGSISSSGVEKLPKTITEFKNKCVNSIASINTKQNEVVTELHQQLLSLGKPTPQNAKKAAQIYLMFQHEVQAYKQHLATKQNLDDSFNVDVNSSSTEHDKLNDLISQFGKDYEHFRDLLPKINKDDVSKKINSEIVNASEIMSNLTSQITLNLANISDKPEYKEYVKSLLSQIAGFENLTDASSNKEHKLSNIDILSTQIRYVLQLKEVAKNLSNSEEKQDKDKFKSEYIIPKNYFVLKSLKELKKDIKEQPEENSSISPQFKQDLLDSIKKSISFQKGRLSNISTEVIPSMEEPAQVKQDIIIPSTVLEREFVKFIRDMKNFNLPTEESWKKFDDYTQKVDIDNKDIIFHKQKSLYCGIASLKNYFQNSSFKDCIDILSKNYDADTYDSLIRNLTNILSVDNMPNEAKKAVSFIIDKLENSKPEDGIFKQDNFNITEQEFKPYQDILSKLFNIDNAKDLTAKLIDYIKPSYDILRSFSSDVEGSGIDLSKSIEIFSRYSIGIDGKIHGSEELPPSIFLDKDRIYYQGSELVLYRDVSAEQKEKIKDILKNVHQKSDVDDSHLKQIQGLLGITYEGFVDGVKKYQQELNTKHTEELIKNKGVILSSHENLLSSQSEGDFSHGHYLTIQKSNDSDSVNKYYVLNSLHDKPEEFDSYESAFKSALSQLGHDDINKNSNQLFCAWVEDKNRD